MPPRAPSSDDNKVVVDPTFYAASAKTVVEEQPILTPETSRQQGGFLRSTRFHWELNAYTALALAFIYFYLLPVQHRVWMHLILALVAVDAARYYTSKGRMPGVPYTFPMVTLLAMLIHPVRFWAEMGAVAMGNNDDVGMCSNTLVGHFMVFVTDPALCREIMTGEGVYGFYAHPNALWLFGEKNLIYLDSEPHKHFRALLTPALFSQQALIRYSQSQEQTVRRFLTRLAQQCADTKKPMDARLAFRTMATVSSQEAFLGPYVDEQLSKQLEDDILTFTMGFLSFPFPYAGGLRQALLAKHRIEEIVQKMVPRAREYIQAGNEPRCMLDFWSAAILERAQAEQVEPQQVAGCSDDNLARTVLDFLFAAQDATNSALTYALDVLDAHRDVLDKVRQEVQAECGNNADEYWVKARESGSFPYTTKVANQLLHHKPPVPMVPHLTKVDTVLGGYPLAKGTVVIPSITFSARVSGASLEFLPERPDDDALFVKTVVFGAGQHKCPGRRYAESLMKMFLIVLAGEGYDFYRTGPRPSADEYVYYPTLFPKDCNFVLFQPSKQ